LESDDKKEILEFDTILDSFKDKNIQISVSESINESEEIK
jgi:hypothetical protein